MASIINPIIMGGGELKSVIATQSGNSDVTSSVLDTKSTKSKQIVYMFAGITEFKENPITFYLQGSNNNSNWTNIKSWSCNINGSYQANPSQVEQISSSYRYFRAYIDGLNGGCRGRALIVGLVE